MRYVSDSNISFSLEVNGKDKRIKFTPCMDKGSILVTDDPHEIKALEESDMYDRVYRRHPDCVDEQVESVEQPAKAEKKSGKKGAKKGVKEVVEVTNWQQAKEYLVDNCGASEDILSKPEDIANAARDNNVSFPNIEQ